MRYYLMVIKICGTFELLKSQIFMTDDKLLGIINTVLNNNDLNTIDILNPDTHLQNDLMLDSLMLAELTVRIEDAFDIDVFEDGMVYTIGDLSKKIK